MGPLHSLLAAALVCAAPISDSPAVSAPGSNLNYAYLYYENGYPTRFKGRRPQSEADLAARADPDLVVQTGYYSLMFDGDDVALKGYDALAGSDYLTALQEDVSVFSPAAFNLRVDQGGVAYDCTGALVQDADSDNVRLIESGQYLKRFDHLGLVFEAAGGQRLGVPGRLEVSAWPDRVTFLLDFSGTSVTRTRIELTSPGGVTHLADSAGNRARLTLMPHEDLEPGAIDRATFVTRAVNLQTGSALPVSFDRDVHALRVPVPAARVSYPGAADRVDSYLIEVTNPRGQPVNLPLVFEQPEPRAITGTVMLLCEAGDGRPTGIPVQVSKNWHRDAENPGAHEGPWLRGSALLTLGAGETRRFMLRVVYGYWGGAGAVSHAQLSLIGWGANWKWDESALGAWGESMTYDPTLHAGDAFVADVRPAFTVPYGRRRDHGWTENVGGADFLVYRDSGGVYRRGKRIKTCYRSTGPNLTDVRYSGLSGDGKIRFTYRSRAVATLDYHRRFHGYRYEFLQDVDSPRRLVYHQVAADYYNSADYTNYTIGDAGGGRSAGTVDRGGNTYKGPPVRFDGRWLSIEDLSSGAHPASALRGIIPLWSTLNGAPAALFLHRYGTRFGDDMCFDFSAASVGRSYVAGDVVEGEFIFVLPPVRRGVYWGGDTEFAGRLAAYGDVTWEPVRDEYLHNARLGVTVHRGELLGNYPVEIRAADGVVPADFTVGGGGVGHLPVVLRGAPANPGLVAQRRVGDVWVDLESVDVAGHAYYQATRNPDGSLDFVFSIPRPSRDLRQTWRVRLRYADGEVPAGR